MAELKFESRSVRRLSLCSFHVIQHHEITFALIRVDEQIAMVRSLVPFFLGISVLLGDNAIYPFSHSSNK